MSQLVQTICPYCAAGCGLYLRVEGGRAVGIEYMADHPACRGALCPKGNTVLDILYHKDRLLTPLKRQGSVWVQVTWEHALDLVSEGLGMARDSYGPLSLGFLGSSKCTNEENYLFQKLARMLGSPNIDNCARLCHASTVVGLGRAMGACATTNPLSDLVNSSCIFVIGSNFAENHPIVARYVIEAKEAGATIIVADPRRTPTAWLADVFLQLKPGTDIALLNGMMNVIVEEGLVNTDYMALRTRGFESLRKGLVQYSPRLCEEITGVPAGSIIGAARAYARSKASAILYSMGVTQHACGTDNVQALANLFLICGHIGRKGAGIFPLRGQNNVQGACDMGTMTEFYPGYWRPGDPKTVQVFGRAWGAQNLPARPGLTALEMIKEAGGGIRAMYIMGENPALSDPNSSRTIEALESLDFLAVQDIFMTSTAKLADVILPGAAWAEKEGTFTSTERRVQWTSKAVVPPGNAKDDLWIVTEVARRMGLGFEHKSAENVLEEIKTLVPTYRAISRERMARDGFIWIFSKEGYYPKKGLGSPILHADGFRMPEGRAVLKMVHYRSPAEQPSLNHPLILTTGRTVAHYNTGSMTRRTELLRELEPELYVEINPEDASERNIGQDDLAVLETARGEVRAKARITDRVKRGVVFIPFHFPGANQVTNEVLDREARIPELKVASCQVRRA